MKRSISLIVVFILTVSILTACGSANSGAANGSKNSSSVTNSANSATNTNSASNSGAAEKDERFTDLDATFYVNVPTANIRKTPSSDAEMLTQLPKGTEVKVTGKGSGDVVDWYRVEIDGQVGYAGGKLLSETKPSN